MADEEKVQTAGSKEAKDAKHRTDKTP